MYQAHYLTTNGLRVFKRTLDPLRKDQEQRKNIDRRENIDNIIRLVYNYFDVPLEFRFEKSRITDNVRAKQFSTFYIKKEYSFMTWLSVAENFKQDHATAIHSYKKIKGLIEFDKEYQLFNQDLVTRINLMYK